MWSKFKPKFLRHLIIRSGKIYRAEQKLCSHLIFRFRVKVSARRIFFIHLIFKSRVKVCAGILFFSHLIFRFGNNYRPKQKLCSHLIFRFGVKVFARKNSLSTWYLNPRETIYLKKSLQSPDILIRKNLCLNKNYEATWYIESE